MATATATDAAAALSWTAASTWTSDVGAPLEGVVTVDTSDVDLPQPQGSAGGITLVRADGDAPCEITVCFNQKHEIHRVYVHSTARVYELYYAADSHHNEYLCTVRCGPAIREEKTLSSVEQDDTDRQSHNVNAEIEDHPRASSSNDNDDDGWVQVKIPDVPSPTLSSTFSDSKLSGNYNVEELMHYEATADISDVSPCVSVTIRLLSLQPKSSVHIEEIYIYADPVDETSHANCTQPSDNSAANSLFAMLVPSLLQMSRSRIGNRDQSLSDSSSAQNSQSCTNIDTKNSRLDIKGSCMEERVPEIRPMQEVDVNPGHGNVTSAEQLGTPGVYAVSSGDSFGVTQQKNRGSADNELLESTKATEASELLSEPKVGESNGDFARLETLLNVLVSKVEKIEFFCSKFEDTMMKPLHSVESRLQRLEQNFDLFVEEFKYSQVHTTKSPSETILKDKEQKPTVGERGPGLAMKAPDFVDGTEKPALAMNAPDFVDTNPGLSMKAPDFVDGTKNPGLAIKAPDFVDENSPNVELQSGSVPAIVLESEIRRGSEVREPEISSEKLLKEQLLKTSFTALELPVSAARFSVEELYAFPASQTDNLVDTEESAVTSSLYFIDDPHICESSSNKHRNHSSFDGTLSSALPDLHAQARIPSSYSVANPVTRPIFDVVDHSKTSPEYENIVFRSDDACHVAAFIEGGVTPLGTLGMEDNILCNVPDGVYRVEPTSSNVGASSPEEQAGEYAVDCHNGNVSSFEAEAALAVLDAHSHMPDGDKPCAYLVLEALRGTPVSQEYVDRICLPAGSKGSADLFRLRNPGGMIQVPVFTPSEQDPEDVLHFLDGLQFDDDGSDRNENNETCPASLQNSNFSSGTSGYSSGCADRGRLSITWGEFIRMHTSFGGSSGSLFSAAEEKIHKSEEHSVLMGLQNLSINDEYADGNPDLATDPLLDVNVHSTASATAEPDSSRVPRVEEPHSAAESNVVSEAPLLDLDFSQEGENKDGPSLEQLHGPLSEIVVSLCASEDGAADAANAAPEGK